MTSRYCKRCERYVIRQRVYAPWHLLHLLLSLVTVGFWIPIWLLIIVLSAIQGYQCPQCGKRLLV